MRVSDDRYDRDRSKFDLALRMARHGARNRLISEWTGLSEDRLRKLSRTYMLRRDIRPTFRIRARRASYVESFLKTSAVGFEASTLGSLFCLLGLVSVGGRPNQTLAGISSLRRTEVFCEAYESYLALHPFAQMSFEHAWLLLTALDTQKDVKLNVCGLCGRLYLADTARIEHAGCGCGIRRLALPRLRRSAAQRSGRNWSSLDRSK